MNSCYAKVSTYLNEAAVELPCYPDEIGDSTSANWSDESIIGRSAPISAYTGTGYRNVTFSFPMHREMAGNIESVIKTLRASVYPRYESKGLTPPITTFRFGDFYVKGIVRNISFTWKKPIINEVYQVCEVSVNIDATPNKVIDTLDIAAASSLNPMKVSG